MRDDTAQPREERGAAIHMIGLSAAFADAPLHAPAALSSSEAPSLPVDGSAMWQTDGADLALSFDAKADAAPDLPRAPSEIGTETSDAMPTQPVEAVVWAEDAQAVAVSDVELNADAIGGRSPDESDMVEGANGPAQTVADPSPEPAEEASEAAAPSMQDGAMDMVETNASSPSNALTFPDGETELTLSELEAALGRPLDADDILVVPMGATLIIDGDVELGGLIVQGTATVADMADIAMSSDWVLVMGGGQFEVGTEANPHAHDFTLTLTGDDPDQDLDISGMLMAAGVPMMEGMGNMTIENQDSFLMVMGEGSALNLHSADAEKTSWTQLDGTAEAGATSITLAEATGWQIGDVIAIASTDFNPDQAEELTVTAVSSDGKTISFMPPLDFMHYGEVDRYNDPDGDVHQLDMRAEVSLLSRNIKIQGDVDYDDGKALNQQDDGYGGHTMVMNGGEMYVSGVEFAYMGQAGILGKYPVHWHESGDVSGQYITNSSIHHSFNKGITVHNTQGAEVRGNVVFETISHNYYMEQNETAGNYLIDNLGINARHVGRFDEIRGASDNTPANFYTTNAENTWIGNHGAGSEHYGFYFDLSRDERYGFGTVENNSVHSIDSRAFYVHHGGMAQDGSPQGDPEQPQKAADWVVTGLTVYKSGLGVYSQAANGTFTDSVFAEMGSNGRFRLNTTIEDSLIIGRSDNIGNPETNDELDAGRSLPGGDGDFQGWQLYDGPGSLSNVMFEGFTEDDDAIQTSNAIHKTASFGLEGITWGENVADAAKFSIGGGGNAYGVDAAARGLVDIDGSISGVEGAMIYQLSSDGSASEGFNAGAAYEINRDWGTIITTSGEQSATLTVDRGGTPETNTGKNHGLPFDSLGATRSDGEYANDIRQQVPLFDGYTYDLAFRDADQDNFRLYLGDADWGQSFIVSLGDEIPATSSFTIHNPNTGASRPAREVSSMEMLEASPDTAVFRDADGVVHVKLVGEMAHGYLWPQPGAAPDGFLNSGVTVLVDMEADLDLGALVFNDPQPGDALGPPPYAEGQDPTDPPEDPPAEDPPAEDPPEDPPAEDPPSDAETVTAFVEENGWVMIEAESYEDLPEGWVKKGDYDKVDAPDLGALGGKNDFVMWQGGDQSDAPGEAVLTYYIVIDTPGLYEFRMRDQPGTDRPEVGGDTWVKIDGARFYGANGDSMVYPDGADPSDYPSDAQMLSEADGQDGFMRYQSTNRSTHWGSGGYVNDTGDRDDRHDIVVEFDAPGVYAVHFSGATPSSHAMGSFGLFNPDLTDGVDLQGAESARREVVLDEAPTPPEAPGTAPDAVDDSFEVMAEAGRVRLNVLANDSDAETHSLTIVSVGDAGKGSVEIVGKRVVYTADEGASGSDSFTYTIEDKDGRQSSATVSVEIDDSAQATGRLELGHTAFEQRRADEWHSVTFDKAIKDAVVVLGPVTFNGAQASVAELRNVTDTGFEMRIAEWAGSGYHKVEEISWMAASAGTHQLADGTLVQAGMTSAVDEVPANVSFAESFGGATDPIVFAQVASDKGGQTVTTRIDAVDEDGFSVQMQEAEAADGQHMREDIGWIALEGDSTAFDHLGTMSLDDNWTKLHSGPGKPTDVMLADMQTFNGTDTATLRYQDRANGVAMVVQEEVTLDAETNHAVETVGYLLGNSGSYDLYS